MAGKKFTTEIEVGGKVKKKGFQDISNTMKATFDLANRLSREMINFGK